MEIQGPGFVLRPWLYGDETSLAAHASNWNIWVNLTDGFPYPYTETHARRWVGLCQDEPRRSTQFAIVVDGRPVGGIGFEIASGIHRKTARIGYWLGEAYWGRGITTEALRLVTAYAFRRYELDRIEAEVFEYNLASARVLEKAGYTLEARLRSNCFKNGRVVDSFLYARLKADPESGNRASV